jgi:hypothetical protein
LAFETCHRIAHRWDELGGPPLGYEGVNRDAFWLRCDRCAMLRAFEVSKTTGMVVWSRYFPPEGYYWQGTRGEAPSKQDYRLDWVRELMHRRRGN